MERRCCLLKLRKWQAEALKRSEWATNGIFLEALGGRGKSLCALEIAKKKGAKKVLVINNRLSILEGWKKYDYPFEVITMTDKTLASKVKKGHKIACDVLILDEWQNISADACVRNFAKIKRKYTIGLSATPIRKKGQNFYPLEKTVFGWASPNRKFDWQKEHGKMVYDPFTYSKEKWLDFKDYDKYVNNLPNFFRWEEIEEIENAQENNGFEIKSFRKVLDVANPELLKKFQTYNLVTIDGKTAVAKQSFGRNAFETLLKQVKVEIDFPKLKATDGDTPLLKTIDGLIERCKHGMLIVSKSRQIVELIHKRNPHIGMWTGAQIVNFERPILVATSQTLGAGVDGLQSRFQTIAVLDPVEEGSGAYDDYRQLLWRITGSRQMHDVNIIEFYYKEVL